MHTHFDVKHEALIQKKVALEALAVALACIIDDVMGHMIQY